MGEKTLGRQSFAKYKLKLPLRIRLDLLIPPFNKRATLLLEASVIQFRKSVRYDFVVVPYGKFDEFRLPNAAREMILELAELGSAVKLNVRRGIR